MPGGGKNDLWQGLNCKGKYAGELRLEMTYYDTRPKPEKPLREGVTGEEDGFRQSAGSASKVKRRPLPNNPNNIVPDVSRESIPPGRAKHGPREYRTPLRAHSMPPETISHSPQQLHGTQAHLHGHPHVASQPASLEHTPQNPYYQEPEQYQRPMADPFEQPDFLPQLPPSGRQRSPMPSRQPSRQAQPMPAHASHSHLGLAHSHSAPIVPLAHPEPQAFVDDYQLRTDYPEPLHDVDYQHRHLRQRRNDVPPGWQEEYGDSFSQGEDVAPPPPPMHSNSAPVVPHATPPHPQSSPASRYGITPPSGRHHSVPSASVYGQPQRTPVHAHPARGGSLDHFTTPPNAGAYGTTPPSLVPGQTPSPYARAVAARTTPHRHSVADSYGATPPRPHPLSQQISRARSPQPYSELPGSSPQAYNQPDYGAAPLIKPRAVSPRPPTLARPRSSYSIQHPVHHFETSDYSPLSTSRPPTSRIANVNNFAPTARKTVSPQPSPTDIGRSGIPFSPDSFDIHNPNARPSPLGASPHSPYHIRSDSETPRQEQKGPIVGWHGQEIDPSDHLPVEAWAPEPEKKTPTKTYGTGRDRDFGPRAAAQGVTTTGGRVSKDTVLAKKPGRVPSAEPLRGEHPNYNSVSPVPDPYEQGRQQYSQAFHDAGRRSPYGGGGGGVAPSLPPKVPVQEYSATAALSRELSTIDIGAGRRSRFGGGVPAPTAYVPVRSHRDRDSYY